MELFSVCVIAVLLAGFGAAVFSVAAGLSVYPALQKKFLALLSLPCDASCPFARNVTVTENKWKGETENQTEEEIARAEPNEGGEEKADANSMGGAPRAFCVREFEMRHRGSLLRGRLLVPGADAGFRGVRRIWLVAPSVVPQKADGAPDCVCFRMTAGADCPAEGAAVFVPAPAERVRAGKAFSFGVREGRALLAWRKRLGKEFPDAEFALYGRGVGAAAVLFCAAARVLARRTRRTRRAGASGASDAAFSRVVADSPYFSAPGFVREELARVFPGGSRRRLIFAGVAAVSWFSGAPLFRQNPAAALERVCRVKRRMRGRMQTRGQTTPDFVLRFSACADCLDGRGNSGNAGGGGNAGSCGDADAAVAERREGQRRFFLAQARFYENFLEKKTRFCDMLFFERFESMEILHENLNP